MSHIHLPDGVLPNWLWICGFLLAILIWVVLLRTVKQRELAKRLPLLGMMAAAMVLGASVEIIPPVYHINLTAISGILLGPALVFLATFVVNVILALFGHGGITVIGLNTLTLSLEGILAYALFRLFWRTLKRLTPAVFLATFLALSGSTLAMIGVVSLGAPHYDELIHEDGKGIFDFKLLKGKEAHPETGGDHKPVDLARFITIVLLSGFVGWVLEGVITVLMVRYIHRIRPDLLPIERGVSTV